LTRSIARIVGLLIAVAWLGGCAGSVSAQQASLLAGQRAAADVPAERKRLFYIGLALYSETWSANDIVELADELRQSADYDVVPLIASNFVESTPARFPIADDAAIAAMVKTAAERAMPDDIVFVHISTHGARGVLARKIGNNSPTVLPARSLAQQLAPLAGRRTVIVISACYSGSLIADLRSPQRIIVTAARADRSSFGCAAGNRHTWFGEAELHGFAQPGHSLRQVVSGIRDEVARMERERRLTPSEPQVAVGEDVRDLYEAPVF
jgi:hypothetical protein